METTFPVFSNILIGLTLHRSYAGNPSCCEFMGTTAISCPEALLQQSPPPPRHLTFLPPFLPYACSLGGWDSIRMSHLGPSTYSLRLHFVSPLTAIHCKNQGFWSRLIAVRQAGVSHKYLDVKLTAGHLAK